MHARVGTIGGAAHDDEHKKTTITDVHELKALLLYKSSARRINQTSSACTQGPSSCSPSSSSSSSSSWALIAPDDMCCHHQPVSRAVSHQLSQNNNILHLAKNSTKRRMDNHQQAGRQAGSCMHECVHARMQCPHIPIYRSRDTYKHRRNRIKSCGTDSTTDRPTDRPSASSF
eukprot:GHVU01209329.1.p1 GENE.GHVU01209329.1~~GHVU01209329.1.p1  ORF type:complete len:173 (+),score=24.87 GHVU01209329.1:295-813(+)